MVWVGQWFMAKRIHSDMELVCTAVLIWYGSSWKWLACVWPSFYALTHPRMHATIISFGKSKDRSSPYDVSLLILHQVHFDHLQLTSPVEGRKGRCISLSFLEPDWSLYSLYPLRIEDLTSDKWQKKILLISKWLTLNCTDVFCG